MKNRAVLLIIVLATWMLLPQKTLAHLSGQPPFFKINGVYTDIYPIQKEESMTLSFPQDISPTSYVIDEPLVFELDPQTIPYPTDSLQSLIFEWDFGDGTKATGLKNTHSYKKPGTYKLVVTTRTPDSDQAFLLQDTFIQIKPTKDYALPKPLILINGKKASDYPLEFAQEDLSKPLRLSVELPSSTRVTSLTWDLGDGVKRSDSSFTHTFPGGRSVATPVLRVRDEHGIIIDVSEPIVNKKDEGGFTLPPLVLLAVLLPLVILIALFTMKRRKL